MNEISVVTYWWTPVELFRKPSAPPPQPVAAFQLEQQRLPRVGQVVTWVLPHPTSSAPVVIARGRVTQVIAVAEQPGLYVAHLQRCPESFPRVERWTNSEPLWSGFHPEIGCVEGPLLILAPDKELAGIADPLFAGQRNGIDAVVWVDWTTVTPLRDLSPEPARPDSQPPTVWTSPPPDLPPDIYQALRNLYPHLRSRDARDVIAKPFLLSDLAVLLVLTSTPAALGVQHAQEQARGLAPHFEFTHRLYESQASDYDTVTWGAVLPRTVPSCPSWQSDGLKLCTSFVVQPLPPDDLAPVQAAMDVLHRLTAQKELRCLFFVCDAQAEPTYAFTLTVPFSPAAQSKARQALTSALSYARERRHTPKQWLATAVQRKLAPARTKSGEHDRVYATVRTAYLRGVLAEGSIAELDAFTTAQSAEQWAVASERSHQIAQLGPKRRALLRQMLGLAALEAKPAPFWVAARECRCAEHYDWTLGRKPNPELTKAQLEAEWPIGTVLTVTDKGQLVVCCEQCYTQRQTIPWTAGAARGLATTIVATSAAGFVEGHRYYEGYFVPLSGDAVGQCFSSQHLTGANPPTPLRVLQPHLVRPASIERNRRVSALIAALQQ